MTKINCKTALVAAAFAFPVVVPVVAQAETSFTLGAAAAYSPDYVGSDDYEVGGAPLIGVEWESDDPSKQGFDLDLHSAELGLLEGLQIESLRFQNGNHRFSLIGGLGADFGRDADDNEALNGLGDIDLHMTGSLTLAYGPAEMKQRHFFTGALSLGGDLTGETDSVTIGGEVKLNHAVVENLIVSHGPHLTWANDDHMQSYFGIDATQAANSIYSVFEAESGLQDVGYSVGAQYKLTDHVGLFAQGDYAKLLSDAADSPLVDQQGSDNQFTFFTGVAYKF